MSKYVIEGTWEEIKRREAELIGQYLRVTINPRRKVSKTEVTAEQKPMAAPKKRVLVASGAFRDALPSSEQYMAEKRAEIELEERNC